MPGYGDLLGDGKYSQESKPKNKHFDIRTDAVIGRDVPVSDLNGSEKTFTVKISGKEPLPEEIKKRFEDVKWMLIAAQYVLRTTGNPRDEADAMFQNYPIKETYPPFKLKEVETNWTLPYPEELAYSYAKQINGADSWEKIPIDFLKKNNAATVHQFLGKTLKDPTKILLCYSPGGEESSNPVDFSTIGFLFFPLKVAGTLGTTVFNLAKPEAVDNLKNFIS